MSGTAPYDEVKRWCELAVSSYPFFDSFLASTAVIANTLKRYGKPVYIMKNVIDDSYMLTHNISSNEDNPLSILIASGTKTHDHDLSTSYLDLLNFMLLHPDTTLSLLGDLDNDFSILGERCQKIPRLSYADMIGCLAQHDLLIVPLHKNPFNDGKSCIKFMEAASGLTPVLASSCKEFELAIKDGVTGFLYRDNFFEKLEEVYARRKEFPAIAASASAEVRKTHSTCSPATDAVEYLRSLVCKNVSPSTITMCLSICVLLSTLTCSMKFLPTAPIVLSSCQISSQGKNISSHACFC